MKNIKLPNALLLFGALLLVSLSVFSFKETGSEFEKNEGLELSVTSSEPGSEVVFDFCLVSDIYEKGRKDFKAQKTPFKMTVPTNKVKMLFKKTEGEGKMVCKVLTGYGGIQSSWPVSVMIIDEVSSQTFGM